MSNQFQPDSKVLNVSIWTVQGFLGISFFMIGMTNIFTSNEDLIELGFTYIAHVPTFVPKFAGISEVLGGIGLILPAATRIQPQLTVWAATGLMLVVIIAIIMYSWLGQWANIPSPIVTGGLLAFVIWGRNSKLPIPSR